MFGYFAVDIDKSCGTDLLCDSAFECRNNKCKCSTGQKYNGTECVNCKICTIKPVYSNPHWDQANEVTLDMWYF